MLQLLSQSKLIIQLVLIIIAILVGFLTSAQAQIGETSELFTTLEAKDSLLFEVGFNQCDISQFEQLVAEDFEFYHDKAGIDHSKADFVASMRDGLCQNGENSTRRELVKGSLEVFPLYNNGTLYGAIQRGRHQFYETTARFTHLWLLESDEWKIARVLSFDHITPEPNNE
ncbi:MAG: nuclear transport factor 2 family protein [Bacteroidota bacterium]